MLASIMHVRVQCKRHIMCRMLHPSIALPPGAHSTHQLPKNSHLFLRTVRATKCDSGKMPNKSLQKQNDIYIYIYIYLYIYIYIYVHIYIYTIRYDTNAESKSALQVTNSCPRQPTPSTDQFRYSGPPAQANHRFQDQGLSLLQSTYQLPRTTTIHDMALLGTFSSMLVVCI